MATVPPIRQSIKFDGLDEIKQRLTELGSAGETAFEQLRAASTPAVKSMERLEVAITNVQRSMASVAVTGRQFGASIGEAGRSFNQFEEALSRTVRSVRNYAVVVAAAATAVALFVRSGIQAGDDIEEQAQALGLSAQAYQELGFAASEAGVKQGQFASGVKFFSQQIQKSSADAARSLLAFVEGIDRNFDSLGGRIQRVTNAAVVPFATIREAARNLQADLAAKGISRPLSEIETALRRLAGGSAESRAEFERLGRVSLPAARDGLDVLRDGSEKSIAALNKLLPTFRRTEDGSVDLGDAFLKTADHFAKLPDGAQKTAQAMAFFGRAAGPQLIPFLNQGAAGIEGFLAKTRELGLHLSGPQIKASSEAARAFDLLARSATIAKNSIGAALAPLAGTIAGGLTEFISRNQKAINDFARDLNTKAGPYVQAFFDMLSGQENVTEAGEKIDQLRQRFVNFGVGVKQVFTIFSNAFTLILGMLDQAAAAINLVFGTNFSGLEIGVIILITKMVGGFALLVGAITAASGAFIVLNSGLKLLVATGGVVINALRLIGIALVALVGWPALIAAGLAAAVFAIVTYWEQIKAGATAAFAWVVQKATEAWTLITQIVTAAVPAAWQWISVAAAIAWEAVKAKGLEIFNAIASFVTTPIADAFQWILTAIDNILAAALAKWEAFKRALTQSPVQGGSTGAPEPFARGGHVRGPGTATSDSILARLSRGEYVQRERAVRYYGVNAMNALNALRIPKDLFRGFNAGGLVDGLNRSLSALMIPQFNAGGLAAMAPAAGGRNLHPVTFNLPNGRPVSGFLAPSDVVKQFAREALAEQMGQTMPMPSFVGGRR